MPHSCGYEFFIHGRTNTEVSILLEDRNRGRCTMGCFHTASETDLTATGDFVVNKAGYLLFVKYHCDLLCK